MWGTGDGAAALVGHRFGKHHVALPLAGPRKTWEGTGAMVLMSKVIGTAAMLVLIMVVALLGCTAMFLPGIQVLEIKKFLNCPVT